MFNLDGDLFKVYGLTMAINSIPNTYGRLMGMGLFKPVSLTQRVVTVEEMEGKVTILASQPVGAPGQVQKDGKRTLKTLAIPHFPHDGSLTAASLQGVRAFGSASETVGVAEEVARKLAEMKGNHDITHEYMRFGAISGKVYDGDGVLLLNMFTEFGVTEKVIDFELDDAATEVELKVLELKRHIEKNLKGETMDYVHVLVAPEFFDALTTHPKVKSAFDRYQENVLAREDSRTAFKWKGVVFEEHVGEAPNAAGETKKFIAEGEGRAFPMGTQGAFKEFYAPADFIEAVNTPGQRIYVKAKEDEFGRSVKFHTQSNPLMVCGRPATLVRVKRY